jgi:RimJ/RimL family protein N-acetyltransferase
VSRGKIHQGDKLPGFVAYFHENPVGFCTYRISDQQCELVSLNSYWEKVGVASALLDAVVVTAKSKKCSRIWLITTNDNLNALRFYQRYGFHFVKIYPNAIDFSRKLKPQIPEYGYHNIPIRDEIELEIILEN